MDVQEVVEALDHPMNDHELSRILAVLHADPQWGVVSEEHTEDRLTCVLVHHPSGTRIDVAQERSMVHLWNSTI
jgi:hypothetical protein